MTISPNKTLPMVSSRPQKIILNLITLSVLVVLIGESQKQSATMIPSILFCTVVDSSRCRRISNKHFEMIS